MSSLHLLSSTSTIVDLGGLGLRAPLFLVARLTCALRLVMRLVGMLTLQCPHHCLDQHQTCKLANIDRILMCKLDTNWVVYSLLLAKLPRANLSRVRKPAWYSIKNIPSSYSEDMNSFFWLLTEAGKYWM